MKYWILNLLSAVLVMQATAQNAGQQARLLELSAQLKIKAQSEKAEALRVANENGWLIHNVDENGRIIELMRLNENGMPVYFTTQNANGAALINSDELYTGGADGLNLSGAGQTLGEWDGGDIRTTHVELAGRVTDKDGVCPWGIHDHPTHVAGTMIASGVDADAKGMSYEANLDAYDWDYDESEMAEAAAAGLKVSQHSYSTITGWEYGFFSGNSGWHWFGNRNISETEDYYWGFYSTEAKNWDDIAFNAPNYLIVKSAGNDRGEGNPDDVHYVRNPDNNWQWESSLTYRQIDGGATGHQSISHTGTAKNIMTVGAVDNTTAMSSFSGWGPTDDGRIKPDIVAKGVSVYSSLGYDNTSYDSWNGTSMSGPMVSGSVGLLLEHQENLHPGVALRSATMKGLILHTATDLGNTGPDYSYGWGLMNTQAAAAVMTGNAANNNHIVESSLRQDESITYTLEAVGGEPLIATIVWTDPAGTPPPASLNPTTIMLVNDLDIRIADASKTVTQPWVLDPANPSNVATTGDNIRDNIEQVYIASPTEAGIYTITVNHKGTLSGGSQQYSLILTGNSSLSAEVSDLIVTFEFAGIDGSEATAPSYSNNANLGSSTISRGAGLTARPNADRFNATDWALNSIATAVSGNDYMEFTLTPNSGYQFSVSSIYLQMQRSDKGPSGIALRSSVDNYAANLDQEYAISDVETTQNFTFTFSQANSTTPVTYRIYMWAETKDGPGGIGDGSGNDIIVYGTAGAIPDPEPTNHASNFAAAAANGSQINLSWSDNDGAQPATGYLIVGKTGAGTFYQPADNTYPSADLDWSDNNFSVKVPHGTQTHSVAGLNASTQYDFKIYAYTNSFSNIDFKTDGSVPTANATTSTPVAWINEFHYNNTGASDIDESIEVVVKNAGDFTLSGFTVSLYNGNGGVEYDTKNLSDFTPGTVYGDFTFYSLILPENGLQNGQPDGLALSYQGSLISGQFLSYEGTFTATEGPADGLTSTDIGVSEPNTTPVGYSLQLTGHGTAYDDFSWQQPSQSTLGTINNGQSLFLTTWTGNSTAADWNTGNNWDNGVPSAAFKAVIADVTTNPSVSGTIDVTNLEISSGGVLSVVHDGQLTVTGTLTNNDGSTGLFIESNSNGTGSLIHNTADVPATIQRHINGGGYHFVSVPITGTLTAGLFMNSYLYQFDATNQAWDGVGDDPATVITNDQGYMIWYTGANTTYDFSGALINGDFTVATPAAASVYNDPNYIGGYNLVPNPYPSAIDWNAEGGFTESNLFETIWIFNRDAGNYGAYVRDAGSGTNEVSNIIPVGQSFFVQANTVGSGSLTIKNAARTHSNNNLLKEPVQLAEMLRLQAAANNLSDEVIIQFDTKASLAFEGNRDAQKLFSDGDAPQLYSLTPEGNELSINTIPYVDETIIVPVGMELSTESEVTFSFTNLESFSSTLQIFLEDLLTDQMLDLRENSSYSFNHDPSNEAERFRLHFMGVTGVEEQLATADHFRVWTSENQLYVLPADELTEGSLQIEFFDLSGRLIQSVNQQIQKPLSLSLPAYEGIVLVRIQNEKLVQTQKVIIR